MNLYVKQFRAISSLTFLEIIRQPSFLLLTTSAIVFIGLLPILITHTLGDASKLVRDSAMAIHLVGGIILGSLAASISLTSELRQGTMAAILSKPISRPLFFLAKYGGVASALTLFSLCATLATIMSTRASATQYTPDGWATATLLAAPIAAFLLGGILNYFVRRPFLSTTLPLLILLTCLAFTVTGFLDPHGRATAFGALYEWKLIPTSILIAVAILTLSAIAMTLATRLTPFSTLSVCAVVLGLGLVSDYFFGRGASNNVISYVLYSITPNWQHFWTVDMITRDRGVPWAYVFAASRYGGVYLTGILCLGIVAFKHLDIRT